MECLGHGLVEKRRKTHHKLANRLDAIPIAPFRLQLLAILEQMGYGPSLRPN